MEIKIKKSSIFPLCLAAYYAIQVLSRMQVILFPDSAILQQILRFSLYFVILIIVYQLIQRWDNIRILVILEVVVGAVFLISVITGSIGGLDWGSVYRPIAFYYIPLAVAAYNILDCQELLNDFYVVALFSTAILILTAIFSYGNWDSSYDMSLGYIMVFTALILLSHFAIYYNVIDIVLTIILSAFILFVGSRGPFICILSFIALEMLISKQFSVSRKIFFITVILAIAMIIFVFYDDLISYIARISEDLGFNSRSLALLLQGEAISHDSGRNEIWSYYMGLINQSPIIGHGVMGSWLASGTYPHDFFIEIILAFGYPIGILLIVIVFVIAIRSIRSEDKYDSILSILFVSYCTHLFVSASYLIVWQFFVCLALCFSRTRNRHFVVQKDRIRLADYVKHEEMAG